MHDAKDKRGLVFHAVHNQVLSHRQAAVTGAEVLSRTSDIGEAGKREETVRYGVDQAVRNLDAATFLGDVKPDAIKVGFGAFGRHDAPSVGRGEFREKAGASASFHLAGKLLH
jgi:hypothetical protein